MRDSGTNSGEAAFHTSQSPLTHLRFSRASDAFAGGLLACALVLGGATREGALAQALLRLAAIGLLFWAIWRASELEPGRNRAALILLGAILLVPLAQLIPLPPALWALLPGREAVAANLQAAGLGRAYAPLSLAPDATLNAWLSLLPPAAMFLATLRMNEASRRACAALALGVIGLSLGLSLLQIAAGPDSPLRLYRITNAGSGVGFFANRNHQAVLLLTALPLTAYFVSLWLRGASGRQRVAPLALGGAVTVLASVGVIAAGSRAGLLLLPVALLGGLFMVFPPQRLGWKGLTAATATVAALGVLAFTVDPSGGLSRFDRSIAEDERFQAAPRVAAAAALYAPVGAGLGSFEAVYRAVERPERVASAFLNHAHDDYLELWLETGAVGVVILLGFALWAGRGAVRAWRRSGAGLAPENAMGRAGSLLIAVLMLHSLVDYPLRTAALATLFAFACGLLAPPPGAPTRQRIRVRAEKTR